MDYQIEDIDLLACKRRKLKFCEKISGNDRVPTNLQRLNGSLFHT